MKLLRASALYFLVVFSIGFVFGTIRVLLVVPRLGQRWAELLEMPFMITASFFAARWVVRRMRVGPEMLLSMGALALAITVATELTVGVRLQGLTFEQYLAQRDPVSSVAFIVSLIIFAFMPFLVGRK